MPSTTPRQARTMAGAAVGISMLGSTLVVTHASLSSNVLYWNCAN